MADIAASVEKLLSESSSGGGGLSLVLSKQDMAPLRIPFGQLEEGSLIDVRVCGDRCTATAHDGATVPPCDCQAGRVCQCSVLISMLLGCQEWLSKALGRSAHLIKQESRSSSSCKASSSAGGGQVRKGKGFFNEGQYLVISDASVGKVEQLVAEQTGSRSSGEELSNFNYRPNLVLSGRELRPFAEVHTLLTLDETHDH